MWPFKKKPVVIKWKMVYTITFPVTWTLEDDEKKTENIYFYLYESPEGHRDVKWKQGYYCRRNDYAERTVLYNEKFFPWIKGMEFEDIPSYWDCRRQENFRAIKALYSRLLKDN